MSAAAKKADTPLMTWGRRRCPFARCWAPGLIHGWVAAFRPANRAVVRQLILFMVAMLIVPLLAYYATCHVAISKSAAACEGGARTCRRRFHAHR